MLEQEIIELRPFDLICHRLAGKPAIAKDQRKGFAAVAEMKLRAELLDQPNRLQFFHHADLFKDLPIIRQQRLADMKAWKVLFLQHEDALAKIGRASCR